MQAFPSSEGVHTVAGRKDVLPRSTRLANIEIDVVRGGIILDGGHIINTPGTHQVCVRRDLVDSIRKHLVWDEDEEGMLQRAMEDFEIEADNAYGNHDPKVNVQDVREARKLAERIADFERRADAGQLRDGEPPPPRLTSRQSEILAARSRYINEEIGHVSVEAAFNRLRIGGMRPLRSLKVLEDDLPLPEEADKREFDAQTAHAITRAVLENSGAQAGGGSAEVIAQIKAELRDEIKAELLAEMRRSASGSESKGKGSRADKG